MNKAGFLFLGAVMSLGSLLLASTGCGDDTTGAGGSGGTGSTSATTSTHAATTGATTGASSSTGGAAATCASYCKDNVANCTGDNAQYKDEAQCNTICTKAAFPAGTPGATTGDSLECRAYHTGAAKSTMKPEVHCGHSGLNGGDIDPKVEGGMQCGDAVEAFCKLAVATCTGQTGAYADVAACTADQKTVTPGTTPFSYVKDGATPANTFDCRVYHLMAAVEAPATHCAHIKADSPICK